MSSDDAFWEAIEPLLEKYRDSDARRRHLFDIKCVRLAPDLETCEALMRFEKVPRSKLDQEWAKAYGL